MKIKFLALLCIVLFSTTAFSAAEKERIQFCMDETLQFQSENMKQTKDMEIVVIEEFGPRVKLCHVRNRNTKAIDLIIWYLDNKYSRTLLVNMPKEREEKFLAQATARGHNVKTDYYNDKEGKQHKYVHWQNLEVAHKSYTVLHYTPTGKIHGHIFVPAWDDFLKSDGFKEKHLPYWLATYHFLPNKKN